MANPEPLGPSHRRARAIALAAVAAISGSWLFAGVGCAADEPVVVVHADRIVPASLQVQLGELVM